MDYKQTKCMSPEDLVFFQSKCDDLEFRSHMSRLRYVYVLLELIPPHMIFVQSEFELPSFNKNNGDLDYFCLTHTVVWFALVLESKKKHENINCFRDFIQLSQRLLDEEMPLLYYSKERVLSEEARLSFVPPDIKHLPELEEFCTSPKRRTFDEEK